MAMAQPGPGPVTGRYVDEKDGSNVGSSAVSVTDDSLRTATTERGGSSMLLSPIEKEVVSPGLNRSHGNAPSDEKQVFDRTDDSGKQVVSSSGDSTKEVANMSPSDTDTYKQAISNLPPISMDKEVAITNNDSDKQVVASLAQTSSLDNLHASFRLEKKNPLGLLTVQSQQIAARVLDPRTGQIGQPSFVTSDMSWTEVVTGLPPSFTVHRPADGFDVSKFLPRGWQGITGMTAEIDSIIPGTNGQYEKWKLKRRGIVLGARTYDLKKDGQSKGLVWKGSTRTVKEVVGQGGEKEKMRHGSLKLVTDDAVGETLAIYHQWRDMEVLGDLLIFNGVSGKVSVEVIVTTAIAVVTAERATGMNWVGGLGK